EEAIAVGDLAALEHQLVRGDGLQAEERVLVAGAQPGVAALDDEGANAVPALRAFELREHELQLGGRAADDERLPARERPAAVDALGDRGEAVERRLALGPGDRRRLAGEARALRVVGERDERAVAVVRRR